MISVRYRHFLLLCVTVVTSITLLAQEPPRVPTRWGVQLGLNYNMAGVGYGFWAAGDPLRPGAQFTKLVLNDGSGIGLYGGLSFQTAKSVGFRFPPISTRAPACNPSISRRASLP
jgi:hypothetical protein